MTTPEEPRIVIAELDDLLASDVLASLGNLPMDIQLRSLRDRLAAIETGLSFGRRMAQGRLDIVLAELERRNAGDADDVAALLGRLPEVLARQTRGGGRPRPVREVDIPEFTEEFTEALDRIVGVTELGSLSGASGFRLSEIAEELAAYERAISVRRREVHRLMDDVQDEIIGRYRTGAASVDDLLHE